MRGSAEPLDWCDRECAAVNHCVVGGVPCDRCGLYYCADELDADGICAKCEREREEEEEGEGDDQTV